MTAKHTPGPWVVSEDPMDGRGYKTLVELPGKVGLPGTWLALCEHNWNESSAGDRRISWAEAEANARLIAAAPELAEALMGIPALPSTFDQYDRFASQYRDWRQRARTALAKAGVA